MNTDENGRLIIHDHRADLEEDLMKPVFKKCMMDWDSEKALNIGTECQRIAHVLQDFGSYYKISDVEMGSRPEFDPDADEEEVAFALGVWEKFFKDFDTNNTELSERVKIAEERLGVNKGSVAYNAFIRAHRFCMLVAMDAPDVIVQYELFCFAQWYALAYACSEMSSVSIMEDEYDPESGCLGAFDESNLKAVIVMLKNDCSLLPEQYIGYTLLMNTIFGENRLDICRSFNSVKPVVDEVLETLKTEERSVIEKRFGLKDGVRRAYDQIALEEHSFPSVVRSEEGLAMRKLRHPTRSNRLKKFFIDKQSKNAGTDSFEVPTVK